MCRSTIYRMISLLKLASLEPQAQGPAVSATVPPSTGETASSVGRTRQQGVKEADERLEQGGGHRSGTKSKRKVSWRRDRGAASGHVGECPGTAWLLSLPIYWSALWVSLRQTRCCFVLFCFALQPCVGWALSYRVLCSSTVVLCTPIVSEKCNCRKLDDTSLQTCTWPRGWQNSPCPRGSLRARHLTLRHPGGSRPEEGLAVAYN